MKFELDDDVVLGISAAGTAAWGLSLLAVPKKIEVLCHFLLSIAVSPSWTESFPFQTFSHRYFS